MITKRKLNKKLDLLLQRQSILAAVVFRTQLTRESQKKMEKKWNDLWYKIMEDKHENSGTK